MNKIKIGQIYGRWKVESASGVTRQGWQTLNCVCQCEKQTVRVISSRLLATRTTLSCGCIRGEKVPILKGARFSRLTVLRRVPCGENGRSRYQCVCSCKNKTEVVVNHSDLRQGVSRSCGCLRKEKAVKNFDCITAESRKKASATRARNRELFGARKRKTATKSKTEPPRLPELQKPVARKRDGYSPEHLNDIRQDAIAIHQWAKKGRGDNTQLTGSGGI